MKLQRTTLILLLLAFSLGGFVYWHEVIGARQRLAVANKEQQTFSFEMNQIQSFSVETATQKLEFVRNQAGKPTWLLNPSKAPASDASVLYLMDLLLKGKSSRTLVVPATQLREYGLEKPQATVKLKLNNQQTYELILGKPDFNSSFLYAQVDPAAQPSGNVEVLLVSTDLENAVNRSLSEWRSQGTK